MEGCIVEEWLRSLGLVHYTQAFLDNGYDDLEVCKQIGCPDMDAIGVDDPGDRANVLAAVKLLLEEGGTRVYFTLEPDYQSPNGDAAMGAPGGGGTAPGAPPGGHCASSSAPGGGIFQGASGATNSSNGINSTPHRTNTIGGRCVTQDNHVDSIIEDYDDALEEYEPSSRGGAGRGPGLAAGRSGDTYDVGRAALVTFPRIQLAAIVRDRAEEDGIDLAQLYQPGHQIEPGGALDELTKRYGAELKTHYHHVLEALRFQSEMAATQFDQDNYSNDTDEIGFSMFSVASHSHRSVPPPLPSCPPPSTSFADGGVLEGSKLSPHHTNRSPVHADPNCHANEELSELGDCDGTLKKRSGIGRFFKNMGVRRSGRKYVYKQHEGDLHASEITMPDEERIELMLLVKEGKLSMHDAVETVKHYENWKRRQLAMEMGASAGQQSPLLDVSPAPTHPHGNHHDCRDPAKVKKVTFSLPLFKLPTLRRKSQLTKQKSLSSADSPVKGRKYALSGSDYCEPPVEISPEEEGLPGFPPLRVDLRAKHKKSGDISDPGHVATYSPSQWISPMLLRRYIKSGDSSKGEQGPPVREQRRGLFSSPFIKRKGSLDSKVASGRGGGGSLRPSGSFGASEADVGRVKGHRGILHSSSLAFGSRESLREQLKPTRSAMSTFGEPLSSARSASRETITVATVHATDCPEDDPMETSGQDDVTALKSVTSSHCRRSPPDGSGNHLNQQGRPPGGQSINENNRNHNGHHHQQHHQHNQCNKLTHSSPGGNPTDTGLRKQPTPNHCDSNSTLRIESCVVCNKNEENLKSELSGDNARDSPDIGIEDTSPTGTLDSTASEDFKDSKYGSSSTMSVGSDVSPVTERRSGKKAIIKPSKLQQHHTNSAGEECMSSDYEDGDELAVKTSNIRSSSGLLKDGHKESLTPGGGSPRHLPSSPSTMSENSHDADSIIYSPRRQRLGRKSSKRPRPKTVEELLGRLGIQHLLSVFLVHGYQSLELFSELEEEDLDELSITQPEDRAKILTAAQLLLDYEGASQEQPAFPTDANSLASSQSQSGISSCDSQHDSLLANAVPAVAHVQKAPSGRADSGSSSDELNLQHATISDQESTSGGDGDEGTLKAATTAGNGETRNSDSDNNLVAAKNQQNSTVKSSKSPHSKSAPSSGVNGTNGTTTTAMTTTLQTPTTMTISTSGSVLPSHDVTMVKLRTSTGTCTSPNLGRRSLTDSSDGGDGGGKKSQSSDSAVSSDMDSSSSSPLRRRAAETSGDETQATSPSSRAKQQQRASTGSGQLVKPPKPKVPVRTVSLPGPTTTGSGGTGGTLGSFRSAQEVTADSSSGKPAAAPRLGKMSSVRDKV